MTVLPSNTLSYYYSRVQRESGHLVDSSFPTSFTDEQQLIVDCINSTLREINNNYWMAFQETSYLLTTTAGTQAYDLRQSPYNQTFWRFNRLTRNGIYRKKDDYPLMFIDFAERDFLQPDLTGNALPTHYSQFGESIYFYPIPDGSQVYVRYYSRAIGTDTTGATQKLSLSVSTDLTMLQDDWEDALVYGAVVKVRATDKIDSKFQYYAQRWDEWKEALKAANAVGEEGGTQFLIPTHTQNYLDRKIGPFFNSNVGQ